MHSLLLLLALATNQLQPASANTGKSGQTIFVLPSTPPAPVLNPAPPLPILTQPTLNVNGQPVAITPGPEDPGFWAWSLPSPVFPTDNLVLSAPAGWLTGYGPLSLVVRNSTGQCEWPLPGSSDTKLALGYNMGGDLFRYLGPYSPLKNWYYRCALWTSATGAQATQLDTSGNPIKLNGTTANVAIYAGGIDNGVDNLGLPGLQGTWTLQWDSADPQTQLAIIPWGGLAWPVTLVNSSPGVNGVGITKTYSCVKPAPGSAPTIINYPVLVLQLTHPQGTPTFSNCWIFPPGNKIDRSDPLGVEENLIRQLKTSDKRGPAVLRWMDATAGGGGQSGVVNPSDLSNVSPSPFNQTNSKTVTAQCTSIRPLDLTVSPNVQTIYGSKPLPGPDPAAIFNQCQTNGFFEVVCPAPHGLFAGQYGWLTQPGNPLVNLTFAGVQIPVRAMVGGVWPTSDTTFILMCQNLNRTGVTNLGCPFTLLPGSYFQCVINTGQCPQEVTAKVTSEFEGCVLWGNIPIASSNDTVDEIGRRWLKYLGPTNKVAVELSNETWNNFVQFDVSTAMSNILGLTNAPHRWYLQRSNEVYQRIKAIFTAANRPNDVLYIIAGQPASMWLRLSIAAQMGLKADITTTAPYFDIPTPADPSWTPAMANDWARHYLTLDPFPRLFNLSDQDAASQYQTAANVASLRWCYEGGLERLFANITNVSSRTYDAVNHPDFRDTQKLFYSVLQKAGLTEYTEYQWMGTTQANGQSYWHYTWQGQPAGDGSMNQMIGTSGVFPAGNVSVKAQAYRDWQNNWWAGRAATQWAWPPTSPLIIPPTPTVNTLQKKKSA